MKYGDRVIVHRGRHKSRFVVVVYDYDAFRREVYVTLRSGCGVMVPRASVRLAKSARGGG
jgi:hypothetical protein